MDYLEKYAQERLEKLKGMRRQCVANLKGLPEGKVYVKKKRKTNQFYKITPDGDRNGKYIKAGERDVAESLVKREYNEKCLNEIEKEIRALKNAKNLQFRKPRKCNQQACPGQADNGYAACIATRRFHQTVGRRKAAT